MKFVLLCLYCGHRFEDWHYDESGLQSARCPRCEDKKLKVLDEEKRDVFGYDKK